VISSGFPFRFNPTNLLVGFEFFVRLHVLISEPASAKNMTRLGVSIMDIVANRGNYMLWSDATNNVHTGSARIFVDLKVLLREFQFRRSVGLEIGSHALFIEDKATDHRNWERLLLEAILVKNDILGYVGKLWMWTGHSHGRIDQLLGCLASAVRKLKQGLINEEALETIFKNVKKEIVDGRLNFFEELDEFPDISSYLTAVCGFVCEC